MKRTSQVFLIFLSCQSLIENEEENPTWNSVDMKESSEWHLPVWQVSEHVPIRPADEQSQTGSIWADQNPDFSWFSPSFFPKIGSRIKVILPESEGQSEGPKELWFHIIDQNGYSARIEYHTFQKEHNRLLTIQGTVLLDHLSRPEVSWEHLEHLTLNTETISNPASVSSLTSPEMILNEVRQKPNNIDVENLKKSLLEEKNKVDETRRFLENQIKNLRAQPAQEVKQK